MKHTKEEKKEFKANQKSLKKEIGKAKKAVSKAKKTYTKAEKRIKKTEFLIGRAYYRGTHSEDGVNEAKLLRLCGVIHKSEAEMKLQTTLRAEAERKLTAAQIDRRQHELAFKNGYVDDVVL